MTCIIMQTISPWGHCLYWQQYRDEEPLMLSTPPCLCLCVFGVIWRGRRTSSGPRWWSHHRCVGAPHTWAVWSPQNSGCSESAGPRVGHGAGPSLTTPDMHQTESHSSHMTNTLGHIHVRLTYNAIKGWWSYANEAIVETLCNVLNHWNWKV